MFEQSLLNRRSAKRPVALAVSVVLQVSLLAIALVVPLVFIDVLPAAQLSTLFVLPPLPVARAAAPAPAPEATTRRVKVRRTTDNVFRAPSAIPKRVARIVEDIEIDPNLAQLALNLPQGIGQGSGSREGVPGLDGLFSAPKPAPPPPPTRQESKTPTIQRIKRGGAVVEAMALSRPGPVYPELAKRARVQGDVELNAVIGVDGGIKELRVASGHPLLVRAAVEAVSQWRYRPTTLNGDPVEVATQITVTFRLR
jgi:protein TonB